MSMLLVLFVSLQLQPPDPLFGTWQLVSSSGPSAYSRVTCKIEPWQEGVRVVYDMVGLRGGVTHWEWNGKLDGKDYPLQGIEENVTDAYSRVDDHTYRVVLKVDGKTATTSTIGISSDGKTMTVTSSSSNTAVYAKRRMRDEN
jgi:hypothetical protein